MNKIRTKRYFRDKKTFHFRKSVHLFYIKVIHTSNKKSGDEFFAFYDEGKIPIFFLWIDSNRLCSPRKNVLCVSLPF